MILSETHRIGEAVKGLTWQPAHQANPVHTRTVAGNAVRFLIMAVLAAVLFFSVMGLVITCVAAWLVIQLLS